MENLVKALKRFDSLETVIAELEVYDRESLNDEADYAM